MTSIIYGKGRTRTHKTQAKDPAYFHGVHSSDIPCQVCNVVVAPGDSEAINVETGRSHYHCAINKAVRLLLSAGLPCPKSYSSLHNMEIYIEEQAATLLLQPDSEAEKQLWVLSKVCEFLLLKPTNWSKLVRQAKTSVH